jgi:uncharacterized protein (TIGR03032 family)
MTLDQPHTRALRDPAQIVFGSAGALRWEPEMVAGTASGRFWELLEALGVTLLVTREYEHLVLAVSCGTAGPVVSALRLPHPSGLVVDRRRNVVHVACTRNPNQIVDLAVVAGAMVRDDRVLGQSAAGLVPIACRYYPGSLYLHDLALVGDRLLGNAVGLNAVVDLTDPQASVVWWPATVEQEQRPRLSHNLIQLNSIAAGATLETSFFTASTAGPTERLPGDGDWRVDRQGVVFDGESRQPVVEGLTRPHSARLAETGELYVNDSGYGRVCAGRSGEPQVVAQLDGWTRGLCLIGPYAIVGVSRVIPRFAQYAPGLDASQARCGLRIVDLRDGTVVGGLTWPHGDQIFAVDWLESSVASTFLAGDHTLAPDEVEALWYRYYPPGARLGPATHARSPNG